MFTLQIVDGPHAGRVFPLESDYAVIGRSQDAEICFEDPAIGRRHAQIVRREETYFIEDLNTRNGTRLNGHPLVKPTPLADGDVLRLGSSTLVFRGEIAPVSSAESRGPSDDLVLRARVPVDPDAPDFQGPTAGQKLQAILRIGQRLAGTLDLDNLLERLLTHLEPLFPTAERGSVVLRRGNDLVPRAQCLWNPRETSDSPENEAIVRLALREGVGVLASPLTATRDTTGEARGMFVCAPLISQDGLRLGAIVLKSPRGAESFRVDDLSLLTAISVQAAVFVENALRHAELVGGVEELPSPARPMPSPAFSSYTVVTRYPAPIALAYRRFCRQREPYSRLKAMFAVLEATLRYVVSLGVCDLLHRLATSGSTDARLPDGPAFDFLRRPRPMTLGTWVEALRETARALKSAPSVVIPELAAACEPSGRLVAQDLARLVALRNALVHDTGSLVPNEDECQEALREGRPILEEVLQQVAFVCDYSLGFAQRSRGAAGNPTRNRYYLHSCMGARVANTMESSAVEFPVPLCEDLPFVVARDSSRLLYLWPLLLQRVATHTERHTLYVFEEIPDLHGAFLTRVRAAAIDVRDTWTQSLREPSAADHRWLLERLRELPAVVDLPPALRLAERLAPLSGGKLLGRTLGTNRLSSVVAVGGFSTVYAAEDTANGRRVAVKVLESPEAQRHLGRFVQEFERLRMAAAHPNIIRCFDWGDPIIGDRECPWYSMEFATGGDLAGRIEERRGEHPDGPPWAEPGPREDIVREFRAVAAAVSHLHSLSIVHRDLKPGNVLIMEDGELRLSDLGLVKDLNPPDDMVMSTMMLPPRTSTGAVLGTRHYMAPEQEQGMDVGTPADVYALGVLLAEMATGRRPIANTQVREGSTLTADPILRKLPDALRRLILHCTEIRPERRPPTGAAVLEAFERSIAVTPPRGGSQDDEQAEGSV